MRFSHIAVLLLGVALAGCQTTGGANLASSPFTGASADAMPEGRNINRLPVGFAAFCLRSPEQCEMPEGASAIAFDSSVSELEAVNRSVNAAIKPESDEKHFGQSEYWTIATDGYGDCEDYALTKRAKLLQAGVPARALRLAVATTMRGEQHSVLTVATDRGDFVLDNLTNDILAWDKTGYAWVSRQDGKSGMGWVVFNDTPKTFDTASN